MAEQKSHPGVAAVLSFVFNGLGQLYNGQIKKGLFIILLSSVGMFIFILGAIFIALWLLGKAISIGQITIGLLLFCLGLIIICILGLYSIFDAYNVAKQQ